MLFFILFYLLPGSCSPLSRNSPYDIINALRNVLHIAFVYCEFGQ